MTESCVAVERRKTAHIIRRIVVLAVIFFSLMIGSCWVQKPAFAGAGKAYVVIGDIEAPWYSTLLRSIFGEVDIRQDLDPVIQAQAIKMKDLGYEVEFIEIGLTTDIERIIKDPATKGIAWFGHGDPRIHGTVATYDGDIAPGDIGRWAEEKLAEKIGWPGDWKALSDAERRKNMELWQNAHFDLEYAYFHTCYSLASNNLPDVLMADNGRFYGYPEKAYLSDTSVLATKIRGKAITAGTPAVDTFPAGQTFPGEPYYGMQISYSVSGANVSRQSDAQQSEAGVVLNERVLSGDLGSGQLLVSGTASVQGRARKAIKDEDLWLRFPGIGGDISASLNVQVVAYDKAGNYDVKRYDKTISVPESGVIKESFNVAVPIPPGARSGDFTIYLTSYHDDGERGVKVSGTFTGGADTSAGYQPEDLAEESGSVDDGQQYESYDGYPQNDEISVHMDGFQLLFDVPPMIENGRTLVPIRRIVEAMGGTVDWYEGGYIDIMKDGRHIYLAIDTPAALVDEKPVDLDVPPRIINGRTLVPLRFVAETFGLNVAWDEKTQSIYLDSN